MQLVWEVLGSLPTASGTATPHMQEPDRPCQEAGTRTAVWLAVRTTLQG
jgi:hypothetical protein